MIIVGDGLRFALDGGFQIVRIAYRQHVIFFAGLRHGDDRVTGLLIQLQQTRRSDGITVNTVVYQHQSFSQPVNADAASGQRKNEQAFQQQSSRNPLATGPVEIIELASLSYVTKACES